MHLQPPTPFLVLAALLVFAPGCTLMRTPMHPESRKTEATTPAAEPKHVRHVVVVVLENQDFDAAIRDDYLHSLASAGMLLKNSNGLFHNSYPNYLALVGGREFPVSWFDSDSLITIPRGPRGESWTIADRIPDTKNYAEDLPPGPDGYRASRSGLYVRRHAPFASFAGTAGPDHLVPVPGDVAAADHAFFRDADGEFPRVAFYSPNMRNDGHDGGLRTASPWLKKFMARFEKTAAAKDTLVVVTFDECASRGASNRIYTVFYGANVRAGVYDGHVNHYNVLRTIEDNFGVPPLADGDGGAAIINGIWK